MAISNARQKNINWKPLNGVKKIKLDVAKRHCSWPLLANMKNSKTGLMLGDKNKTKHHKHKPLHNWRFNTWTISKCLCPNCAHTNDILKLRSSTVYQITLVISYGHLSVIHREYFLITNKNTLEELPILQQLYDKANALRNQTLCYNNAAPQLSEAVCAARALWAGRRLVLDTSSSETFIFSYSQLLVPYFLLQLLKVLLIFQKLLGNLCVACQYIPNG